MSAYLDTRDLWKRQQELQERQDEWEAYEEARKAHAVKVEIALAEYPNEEPPDEPEDLEEVEPLDDDEAAELAELDTLESEISGWTGGETMIPTDDFEDYARELAEDKGSYSRADLQWPITCIDWERAAKELAYDYSEVEYQGTSYYVRNC